MSPESFSEVPSNIKVIAGTLKLSSPKSTYEVENITFHQRFNPKDSGKNDIALVKVIIISRINFFTYTEQNKQDFDSK